MGINLKKNCKNIFKESLSNSIYHTDENLKDFMEWLKKQEGSV